jgi:hypothetical protein
MPQVVAASAEPVRAVVIPIAVTDRDLDGLTALKA